MEILGVDFTSRPTLAKPIVVARGRLEHDTLRIAAILRLTDFAAFEALVSGAGPWVGAFDFPFGLPRELVDTLRWPGAFARQRRHWPRLIRHYAALSRRQVAGVFDAFRAARPPGRKYAQRATERAAGAHPAMKLVNPPVGWMLHEGAPILLRAGVHVPGMRTRRSDRVALEAYPGYLLNTVAAGWGERRTPPYKNDAPGKRRAAHRETRVRLLWGLVEGEHPLQIRLDVPVALAAEAADDGSGDTLDALAAAVQAAWGAASGGPTFGLPPRFDPIEGWIVGAPFAARSPQPAGAKTRPSR